MCIGSVSSIKAKEKHITTVNCITCSYSTNDQLFGFVLKKLTTSCHGGKTNYPFNASCDIIVLPQTSYYFTCNNILLKVCCLKSLSTFSSLRRVITYERMLLLLFCFLFFFFYISLSHLAFILKFCMFVIFKVLRVWGSVSATGRPACVP